MKINFLTLLDPFHYHGGGEKTWKDLIEIGRIKGHEIKVSFMLPYRKIDLFKNPDIFFLVNLNNYGKTNRPSWARLTFPKELINKIINNEKYFHFDNAYCDVCDEGYLPCNGLVTTEFCPFKRGFRRLLVGSKCLRTSTKLLYQKAALSVFLSPLHHSIISNLVGKELIKNHFIINPYIDSTKFFNKNIKRDIKYLYIGVITEAKGVDVLRNLPFRNDIVLVGKSPKNKIPGFGKWLGEIPYSEIPDLLNRAENFIFLPRWPEPKGRVVMEAALCGCNLIINDNVGIKSFNLELNNLDNYSNSREEFWKEMKQFVTK